MPRRRVAERAYRIAMLVLPRPFRERFGDEMVEFARGRLQAARSRGRRAAFREAMRREPEQPLLWNELGYTEAFAGNLDGAVNALREYEKRAPGDANPLDSLGVL